MVIFCFCFQVKDMLEILNMKDCFDIRKQHPFHWAVNDAMIYQFVTSPPVSEYFSDLVQRLRGQCFHLDALVHAKEFVFFKLFDMRVLQLVYKNLHWGNWLMLMQRN